MLAFEEAIQAGTEMVNLGETMIVVTADHSHSFALVGQPNRSVSILDPETEYSNNVSH